MMSIVLFAISTVLSCLGMLKYNRQQEQSDLKEEDNKMNNWMNQIDMASVLAEDVHAPELRNPKNSGMRFGGRLGRLIGRNADPNKRER